jgi:hypothetical protein
MLSMARNALVLFFRGRLFADQRKAVLLIAAGIAFTALLGIALAKSGVPLWGAALVAGFAGGVLQPWLLKTIRFR